MKKLTFQWKLDSLTETINEANKPQFLIPTPSKTYMTGDLVSNWEFFRDSRMNYATATKLADNDKKIVAAMLLSIMGKEWWTTRCQCYPCKAQQIFLTKAKEIYKHYVFYSHSHKVD